MEIRALAESDAEAWWRIRLESLELEPLAFGKSAEEHRGAPIEVIARRFREAPATTLYLGAFEAGKLIGMATFIRESGEKERHKGRIYGVYVAPEHRGKGIGKLLIARLLEIAALDSTLEQVLLSVATTQSAARRLYLSFGFSPFGSEPRALKVADQYVDEDHMILLLR